MLKPTTATPVAPKTTIANMAFSAIVIQATEIDGIVPGFLSHWYVDYEFGEEDHGNVEKSLVLRCGDYFEAWRRTVKLFAVWKR